MQWKNHSREMAAGSHALFGASNYHWLNYDFDKAAEYIRNMRAKDRGTKLHEFAAKAIQYRRPLSGRDTLAKYVNDAIKFGMDTEVPLYFSPYFFGTTDAIAVDGRKLRISDLKTGTTPASIKQLLVYDAFYCLDYGVAPKEIEHELRIYQNDEIILEKPKWQEIQEVMDKVVDFNRGFITLESEGSL